MSKSQQKIEFNYLLRLFFFFLLEVSIRAKLNVPLRGVAPIDRFLIVSCVGTMILIDTEVDKA